MGFPDAAWLPVGYPHRDGPEVTAVDKLIYLLPVLGCAAMVGVMMLMMRDGHANRPGPAPLVDRTTQEEIAKLRAEIAVLRTGRHPEATAVAPPDPPQAGGAG